MFSKMTLERNVRNETLSENLESILDFGKTSVNFKPDSKQESIDGLERPLEP